MGGGGSIYKVLKSAIMSAMEARGDPGRIKLRQMSSHRRFRTLIGLWLVPLSFSD